MLQSRGPATLRLARGRFAHRYFFNRKYIFPAVIAFVTVYWPFTIVGDVEIAVHFTGGRSVEYSGVRPATFVGQVRTRLLSCRDALSLGRLAPRPETAMLPLPLVASELTARLPL